MITNSCTCVDENGYLINYCCGCWDDMLESFRIDTQEWWDGNSTYNFNIVGLPLWNRTVSGSFTAKSQADLIQSIGINGDWTMHYRIDGDKLHVHISHHDASGWMTVTYATEDQE